MLLGQLRGDLISNAAPRYHFADSSARKFSSLPGPGEQDYFRSLMQKSVFCPRRNNSPAAITGEAMKT